MSRTATRAPAPIVRGPLIGAARQRAFEAANLTYAEGRKLCEQVLRRAHKAVDLSLVEVGLNLFKVSGGESGEDHYVNLTGSPDAALCDCGDHLNRECICKHIMRAMLHLGHDFARKGEQPGIFLQALTVEVHNAGRRKAAVAGNGGGR